MNTLGRWIEPRKYTASHHDYFTNHALKVMIIPLLIEQLLQMVVGMMDTMMVSYAGEAAVSGVSLDTMFYTIFIFIFTAIATGGAVVISQYLGSKSKDLADLATGQEFRIAGIVSLVCMVLILVFGNGILQVLYGSAEPAVMDACRTYLWIVTLSFPANAIYNAGAAVYRSFGRTRTTMYVSLAMNTINIIGNAIGVFGLHAGAAGVAWPTTISWIFAAVLMTILCTKPELETSLHWKYVVRNDKDMMKRILNIAIPNAIESGLFQASKVFLGVLISTYGTYQIAANGIAQSIWSLAALASSAMQPVFITVVGQCMGAEDHDSADYYMRKLSRLTFMMCFAWNLAIVLLLPLIMKAYNVSAETKTLIVIMVLIHNLFAGTIQTLAFPLSAGLRAAGDVRFTLWTSIFCTVGLRVIFSYFFGTVMGLGVIGMVLDWSVKAIMDWVRFTGGKWRTMKVI